MSIVGESTQMVNRQNNPEPHACHGEKPAINGQIILNRARTYDYADLSYGRNQALECHAR